MIVAHLFWGFAAGITAATWASLAGLALGGILLSYVLVGAVGLLASAAVPRRGSLG